jgi:PTS system cellobiose-specific IIC component
MSRSSDASRQSSGDSNLKLAGFGTVGWIERRIAPFAERFGNAPAVRALRESLPVAFIGLLVALTLIVGFAEHGSFVDRLRAGIPGSFAVMSIVLVFVLAVRLAQRFRYLIAPTIAASVLAFAFALPRESTRSFGAFATILGTSGPFTAIVCCMAAVGVIGLMRRRFPDDRGVVIGTFIVWIGSYGLYAFHLSIGGALNALIAPLGTLGDSYVALFVLVAIETVLWLFGIHGPALLAPIVLPVYLNLQFANAAAYQQHLPLPHLVVVSTFLFVFTGGAGATLPLVLLLLRSRVPRLRTFAYATIVPSLINTNEPVMFGLPLVYNPVLGIPFVLAPLVLTGTTYLALALGWVRAPVYYVPAVVPTVLNTLLATLDWRSILLMIVNLAIAGAIYLPFVRVFERLESQKPS